MCWPDRSPGRPGTGRAHPARPLARRDLECLQSRLHAPSQDARCSASHAWEAHTIWTATAFWAVFTARRYAARWDYEPLL